MKQDAAYRFCFLSLCALRLLFIVQYEINMHLVRHCY